LDLTNNDDLTTLYCYGNQIKETGMDGLVSSLPTVASGNLYAMESPGWGEGNEITPAQVAAANAKGWKVFKWDAEAQDWVEMSGEVAPTGIAIDATNFPDENFRAWLLSQDYGQDGLLTEEEIAGITEINVSEKGIADLTGIEIFTKLTDLWCDNNQLTSLDVTKNVALTRLECYNNQLTSLDVSKNVALTWLSCYDNQLTSLDVSNNVALKSLKCYINQLTSLDVSNNVALQELYCHDNQLTSLDVSKNTALTLLSCERNRLTSLDVTKNTALMGLYCDNNQLTSLDVTKNVALWSLNCNGNQLTTLDVTKNVALQYLYCSVNQIKDTAMDVLISSLPTVDSGNLYAMDSPEWGEGNEITPAQVAAANAKGWKVFQYDAETGEWVEMSGEVAPTGIAIDATNFPDENFRAWLLSQDYGQDALLTEEEIEGITEIDVSDKEIADLTGIELFTNLTYLWCDHNQLTSLDVSKNVALTELYCYSNQLTSLDLTKNVKLKFLNCEANKLTSLDVTKNVVLETLNCNSNQLTSLDVSKNTAMRELHCYLNQIKDTAMEELISSLPTVDSGNLYAIAPQVSGEGKEITPAQVAAANAKGWKVFQYDAEAGEWVEMSGEDPDGIQSADKGQLTVDDAVIYTLSGQRLSKPQRGVNIINGKKMVVK